MMTAMLSMSSVSGPPDGLPGSDLEHVKWCLLVTRLLTSCALV